MTLKEKALAALMTATVATTIHAAEPYKVAQIDGTQITGVTVSGNGDVFVNAPNWRENVPFAVAKVTKDGKFEPYPNTQVNACVASAQVKDDCFLAVQSVVAHADKLYVLDTRNPRFQKVQDAPRLFVIDLNSNQIEKVLKLSEQAYHSDSYINDLRVDDKTNRIYMTDSAHAGLVVYNLDDDSSYRILDNHVYTKAEVDQLSIEGKPFTMQVQSDGIALDTVNNTLYFHALSGYSLYAINTADIQPGANDSIAKSVRKVAKTGAPDGMIYHEGNVYLADLEKQLVQYLTPSMDLRTLVSGQAVSWADTFSIHNGELYYTNSKIQDAGADVSKMSFEVYKVALPQ
ncbi:L-dopachrome tautomerase-related protein [Salinimonas lutimaris]|uniref:L-dopachrome tautomerase-related protein n=1 Tax=Salinimonas lutimaris TaxID=914153 RepID=UPI0010C101CD|nr:L-dopachrome tautomerase-related protein [Salinimonas lutimaris]